MRKRNIKIVITDFDNTLFDWFRVWYECFSAMLKKIVEISGIDEEVLKREIKAIHQRYGTSEYAFLIEEIPSLQKKHSGKEFLEVYHEAIENYRIQRRKNLKLYPTVLKSFKKIKQQGTLLFIYTESKQFYSKYRIKKLGLDGIVDTIFYPEDHSIPDNIERKYSPEHYKLQHTTEHVLSADDIKPNPQVIKDILNYINEGKREGVIYVGDSLIKDIYMAQEAGIIDVYARYGVAHQIEEYNLLREVTHWTKEMVERERQLKESVDIKPTFILENNFSEIFHYFRFMKF